MHIALEAHKAVSNAFKPFKMKSESHYTWNPINNGKTIKPFNQSLASHLTRFILSFLENNIFMSIVPGQRWQSNSFCPTKNTPREKYVHSNECAKSIKLCQLKFSSSRCGNVESRVLLFVADPTEIWSSFNCLPWSENHILLFFMLEIVDEHTRAILSH